MIGSRCAGAATAPLSKLIREFLMRRFLTSRPTLYRTAVSAAIRLDDCGTWRDTTRGCDMPSSRQLVSIADGGR
jgi:hypothetical protein